MRLFVRSEAAETLAAVHCVECCCEAESGEVCAVCFAGIGEVRLLEVGSSACLRQVPCMSRWARPEEERSPRVVPRASAISRSRRSACRRQVP
jgi:hypothetical protein